MFVNIYVVTAVLLCFLQTCVSDLFFDTTNCGYEQSDSWLAKSPWLAAIKVEDKASRVFYTKCAGALINQKYILTTASCLLIDERTELDSVQLDVTYVLNFTTSSRLSTSVIKTYYTVEEVIVHPQYDFKNNRNNIALIRLNRLVQYSRFTQPICLPFGIAVLNDFFNTSTWSEIDFPSFPIGKSNIASSSIPSDNKEEILTVESTNNTVKLCDGFVGAPLMFTKNNQYYLRGLLIKKVECDGKSPGVYLNILDYLEWIKASVTSNYNQCVTPDMQQSTCISLNDCPILLKAFANPNKALDYLKKFVCSDDKVGGFQVCCPLSLNTSMYSDADVNVDKLSDKRFCGYQHRDDYILADENIALDEFPWLATIRAVGEGNKDYGICSGSLINNRYVVTSAYCLTRSRQITSVRLGEFNVLNKTDCVKVPDFDEQDCTESIDFDIDEAVLHPFYNFWTYNNDIALIRLKTKVTYSDYVRPICLPTSNFESVKLNSTLYTTSFTAPKPWGTYSLKKKLFYTLIENNKCRYKQTVNEYNMCIRPLAKSIDPYFACFDDDGAPAMSSRKNQWILEGITTERVSFCDITQPIVLTRISSYLPWIQDNIRLNN